MSLVADLPDLEVAPRIDRLRSLLGDAGCEGLLVTALVDVRYLTGFTGSAGMLLVLPDDALLVTDGRYREQSAEQVAASGAPVRVGIANQQQEALLVEAADGIRRLGLQADEVTWSRLRAMQGEWFPGRNLVPTEGLVAGLRMVKDAGEIARMAAAAAIADAALAMVRPLLAEEPTEAEVALALDDEMRARGASGPSFDTIVASGPNGAKPHARPGERRLVAGDLVVIDFGAVVDGYCSDMTRTFALGELTPDRQRMLDVVTEAQAAGVAAVRAGATVAAVDAACRDRIEEAGWGEAFLHSTGHGVGLEIHEAPRVSSTGGATLAAGNVVTVEPGVYLPEQGGVRVEDTLEVTEQGSRALTLAPKDPAV